MSASSLARVALTVLVLAIVGALLASPDDRGLPAAGQPRAHFPVALRGHRLPTRPPFPMFVGYAGWSAAYVRAVAVRGRFAFVGAGHELLAVDLGGDRPRRVGGVVVPGEVVSLALSGEHAFAATLGGGLRIVDVHDPAHPVEVGFLQDANALDISCDDYLNDVAVSGGLAFVAAEDDNLCIADVSTPTAPRWVGRNQRNGDAETVAASGRHVFLGNGRGGRMLVYDVSDPARPREVAEDGTIAAVNIVVAGDRAYVGTVLSGRDPDENRPDGVWIFDISNPAAPRRVGAVTVAADEFVGGLAVAGDRLYVATGRGLAVFDVRKPASPRRVAAATTPGWARGDPAPSPSAFVYLPTEQGLQAVDVSDPARPRPGGLYSPAADGAGAARMERTFTDGTLVFAVGPEAVLGSETKRLWWLDMADADRPRVVPVPAAPDIGGPLAVADGHLYVPDRRGAVHVLDVRDPPNAPEVAVIPPPPDLARGYPTFEWPTPNLAVAGGRAHVSLWNQLRTFDVSNPAAPAWLWSCGAPGWVAAWGDRVYLLSADRFTVFDFSNPEDRCGRQASQGVARVVEGSRALLVRGSTAYVVTESGILPVDASDLIRLGLRPGDLYHPRGSGGGFRSLASFGGYLIAAGDLGLTVLDPVDPLRLRAVPVPLQDRGRVRFRDVMVRRDRAYATDEHGFVWVFRLE